MSRLFPSPGSPSTMITCPRPLLARSHAAASAASSEPRPHSSGRGRAAGGAASTRRPTLATEPVFELTGVGNREPFEKVALDECGRAWPVAARVQLREAVAIERHAVRAEADLVDVRLHLVVSQGAPEDAQCLAQRVARLLLVAVAPEQSYEVLAGAQPPRAACEVHEQRDVLAPQELGRRVGAGHRHLHRAEHAAVDACGSRHGAGDYRAQCGTEQAPVDSARVWSRPHWKTCSAPSAIATSCSARWAPGGWDSSTARGT